MSQTPHTDPWTDAGPLAPSALADARIAAHYAAQPMAAAAYALLPAPPDHTHSNLLWSEEHGLFLGRELPRGGRCFLDVPGLRTGLVAASGATVALELSGRTLPNALDDMAELLREVGEEVPAEGLAVPPYDLPDTPIANGAPIEAAPEALAELGRWFRGGARLLASVAREQLGGAEVRGWPHHFDVAALLTLDPDAPAEDARSLNVGLSPGRRQLRRAVLLREPVALPAGGGPPGPPRRRELAHRGVHGGDPDRERHPRRYGPGDGAAGDRRRLPSRQPLAAPRQPSPGARSRRGERPGGQSRGRPPGRPRGPRGHRKGAARPIGGRGSLISTKGRNASRRLPIEGVTGAKRALDPLRGTERPFR